MSALLALLPVLTAIALGIAIGMLGGGNPGNLIQWRPAAWQVAAGAIVLQVIADTFGWTGVPPFILGLASVAALLYVSWMNRRIGGMVVVALGLAMNLVPMLINGGTPVSADAMVSSGALEESQVGSVELTGPRHLAEDQDLLKPLGAVVPLPFGLVISLGDLVSLLGVTLVTQAVLRRRQVRAGGPAPPARNPRVTLATYQEALTTLGQGPADNSRGVEVEHVTIGSSGNVRPVPMRSADSPAPLDMAGPRIEGATHGEASDDFGDVGVTVRPVPRSEASDLREAAAERPRRRVVPPQGDIRPAPSGLDPDTGESAILGLSSLPARNDSLLEYTHDDGPDVSDDLPPGWSRAVDQGHDPDAADAPYSYPSAAPARPARPGVARDPEPRPDEPTAAVPAVDSEGWPNPKDAASSTTSAPNPPAPTPAPTPAPVQPRPTSTPLADVPAPVAQRPTVPSTPAASEEPEPGTRPGGVRRRSAPTPTPTPTPTPADESPSPVTDRAADDVTPDDGSFGGFDDFNDDDFTGEEDEVDLSYIDDLAPTGEHEALNQTQATPVVSPEDSSPGRWKVPASARGRRPTRAPDAPVADDLSATGEVPSSGSA